MMDYEIMEGWNSYLIGIYFSRNCMSKEGKELAKCFSNFS